MDFKQAYREMVEGKKIRRPSFDSYWYMENGTIKTIFNGEVVEIGLKEGTIIHMNSNDWEVVEKNKAWRPEQWDRYFAIDSNGDTLQDVFETTLPLDIDRFNLGNCFRTEEEAEHMVEKLKVISELKNFVLDNNEEKIDWVNSNQGKYTLVYDHEYQDVDVDCYYYTQCLSSNIYFTSKEIAQSAINTVGKDRIKKYYFDVEEE